jgi:C-terminal processing protease CtpA/Prc
LSAEKCGIMTGDYIIFIDRHNIVTLPELDILNLIRSQGNTLLLEIFRRPSNNYRQGSVKIVPPKIITSSAANRQISTDEESSIKRSLLWSSSAISNTSIETTKKRLKLPQVCAISKEVKFNFYKKL